MPSKGGGDAGPLAAVAADPSGASDSASVEGAERLTTRPTKRRSGTLSLPIVASGESPGAFGSAGGNTDCVAADGPYFSTPPRLLASAVTRGHALCVTGTSSFGNSDRLPSPGATCGAGAPTLPSAPGALNSQFPKRSTKLAESSEATGAFGDGTDPHLPKRSVNGFEKAVNGSGSALTGAEIALAKGMSNCSFPMKGRLPRDGGISFAPDMICSICRESTTCSGLGTL